MDITRRQNWLVSVVAFDQLLRCHESIHSWLIMQAKDKLPLSRNLRMTGELQLSAR